MFGAWIASRKRMAADTIGRAQEQAQRLLRDADRDAETTKKEAILDAKEKAHDILMEAERQARTDRQPAAALEQILSRREAVVARRAAASARLEKDLTLRDKTLIEREQHTAAAAAKCEQ